MNSTVEGLQHKRPAPMDDRQQADRATIAPIGPDDLRPGPLRSSERNTSGHAAIFRSQVTTRPIMNG